MTDNSNNRAVKKSRWGVGVFALYGGFVVFIIGLALYVSFQEIQFSEANYYEKGLAYQERIDQFKRTARLSDQLGIAYDSGAFLISYPDTLIFDKVSGTVNFFRPSNAKLDFKINLALDQTGRQIISVGTMTPGLWRIQIEWQIDSNKYYTEKTVFLE